MTRRYSPSLPPMLALLALTACGGGGTPSPPPAVYSVGGYVAGLTGSGLTLSYNGGPAVAISRNGAFTSATGVATGTAYTLTVVGQPANPAQTCSVSNGSGTVATANVTTIGVFCPQAVGTFVYAVTDDEISAYAIDPTTGALTLVPGSAVPPGGGFALQFVPHSSFLWMLEGENVLTGTNSSVYVYTVDSTTGLLTPAAGNPFWALGGTGETPRGCSTGFNGLSSAQSVTFYPSGAFGYTSNVSFDAGSNGGVWPFTIDPATGAPTGLGTSAGLCTGYPVTVDPSGQFAYSPGYMSDSSTAPYGLFAFTIDATTGALTVIQGSPWTIGAAPPPPLATTIDPFGRFAYTPDGPRIWAFTLASTGALSPLAGSPFAFPADSYAIAIAPNGQFAYVDATSGLYTYSIDSASGALSSVGNPVALADNNGTTLQLDPSGRFAYLAAGAGAGQYGIYAYAIDATTGALTPVPGSPFAVGAYPILVAISN